VQEGVGVAGEVEQKFRELVMPADQTAVALVASVSPEGVPDCPVMGAGDVL
jgi:hypothetical protein